VIGIHRDKVRVVKYDPAWKKSFTIESKKVSKALGKDVLFAEHIGSTAIKGLASKPIVDFFVVLSTLKNWEKYIEPLRKIGYTFRIDHKKDRGSILFTKGPVAKRTHHLKLVTKSSKNFKQSLRFRDYLISHPDVAKEYEKIKKGFAKKYKNNRVRYRVAKSAFIKKVLKRKK
jgi:GrpB-like predicted nucleotidyltransferase (UPF0157 family)